MTYGAGIGPWRIWLDVRITRRKAYHIVKDAQGVSQFRSRILSECLAWLAAEGVEDYVLVPDTRDVRPVRCSATQVEDLELWQN